MGDIGIGFLGAGDVALIHKAALLQISGVTISGVFDIDRERSERLASETGATVYSSSRELVESPTVDVVYVLSPLQHHYGGASVALLAGKHTFIEKPVSLDPVEIAEMIRLSEAKSCLCVPGHNYIHAHELQRAREMIASGQVGELRAYWSTFLVSLPPEIRGRITGPLREVMIHQFYSLLFLLGRPERLIATTSDFAAGGPHNEDQVSITCHMPNGALANLFASFVADDLTCDPWTLKYKVLGDTGSISHTWGLSRLKYRPQPVWDLPAYWDTFREEDRYFIEECVRKGRPPLSSMQDAATCLEMLTAAEKSVQSAAFEKV